MLTIFGAELALIQDNEMDPWQRSQCNIFFRGKQVGRSWVLQAPRYPRFMTLSRKTQRRPCCAIAGLDEQTLSLRNASEAPRLLLRPAPFVALERKREACTRRREHHGVDEHCPYVTNQLRENPTRCNIPVGAVTRIPETCVHAHPQRLLTNTSTTTEDISEVPSLRGRIRRGAAPGL